MESTDFSSFAPAYLPTSHPRLDFHQNITHACFSLFVGRGYVSLETGSFGDGVTRNVVPVRRQGVRVMDVVTIDISSIRTCPSGWTNEGPGQSAGRRWIGTRASREFRGRGLFVPAASSCPFSASHRIDRPGAIARVTWETECKCRLRPPTQRRTESSIQWSGASASQARLAGQKRGTRQALCPTGPRSQGPRVDGANGAAMLCHRCGQRVSQA